MRPLQPHRSRRLALLAGLVVALGLPGPATADDTTSRSGDTSAVAINTKDGSSVFKLAFQIRKVTGDVVDNQNAAVAYASCTECQTVAISIQVLLVSGDPSEVAPENVSVALNEDCTLCSTLSDAYQFVVGGATELGFTKEGSAQVRALQKELRELRKSGASLDEIQARVTDITDRLRTVLQTELVPVAKKEDEEPAEPARTGAERGATGATGPRPAGPTGSSGPQGQAAAPGATGGADPPPAGTTGASGPATSTGGAP